MSRRGKATERAPHWQKLLIFEHPDTAGYEHLAWVDAAFKAGTMGRPHLDQAKSRLLCNVSSLAFGGENLSTAYLGCLLDSQIYTFDPGVSGHPPAHWHFPGPERIAGRA